LFSTGMKLQDYTRSHKQVRLMPNTHRRRRRDSTVEFRRVGVGGVNPIRN